MRVAVLDLGSNSVQLLVADVGEGRWREIAVAEGITRLAAGLRPGARLAPEAAARTAASAALMAARARALGAVRMWAVGTRAFRAAADGAAFAAAVAARLGVPVEILSAEREARLGFAGVVAGLAWQRGPALTVDIGGGSTEIVRGDDGWPTAQATLDIGAVVLTERFLRHDPPTGAEVTALRAEARETVATAADAICGAVGGMGVPGPPGVPIAGSGGTVTTLGAMAAGLDCYRAEVVHGMRLGLGDLERTCTALGRESVAARATRPGLDAARAVTILAGAVIACEVLRLVGAEGLVVSDRGVRHAVLSERTAATEAGAPGAGRVLEARANARDGRRAIDGGVD
jgi:exopolyphosphatase/guanosine-5'-triphosphate,3'-diphosphate pyrophosphatase